MSGEGWSCFARLPSGLIDSRSASLTLNWLRSKPTYTGFRLTRDEVDGDKYERNVRLQRLAALSAVFVAAFVTGIYLSDHFFALKFFDKESTMFATVWMGTSGLLVALFILGLTSYAAMRYRRAEPRRMAFLSACVEFEQVDAWRAVRCEPAFWSETLDDAGFEFEAAELLAGHLKTGQVMLTRASNDYGVDVLLCSPAGRIVAQCKRWKRKTGAPEVRELAGSKVFFDADLAILMSLERPTEDNEECAHFAATQNLQYWDLDAIVGMANQMRDAA